MTARDNTPDFDARLEALAEQWAADRDVAAAYLYGSRARGDFRPESDVDLLILEEVPAPIAHRVIRDGRLLVDRDPRRRVEVVEGVLRRYLDEAWLRRQLDEGLQARLAEGRFAR